MIALDEYAVAGFRADLHASVRGNGFEETLDLHGRDMRRGLRVLEIAREILGRELPIGLDRPLLRRPDQSRAAAVYVKCARGPLNRNLRVTFPGDFRYITGRENKSRKICVKTGT